MSQLPFSRPIRWALLAVLIALPSLSLALPDTVLIPIVEPHPPDDPPEAASFSHWKHGQFQCYECHSSIFPQYKKGFTHAEMDDGQYCAACHNGRLAWDIDDSDIECEECHRPSNHGKE